MCVCLKEDKMKQKYPTKVEYIQYPSYFIVSKSDAVFVVNGLHYENLFWLYL